MKEIKVKFCDGLEGKYFKDILSKYYVVVESGKPDFIFYNCHGFENRAYMDCTRIFVTNECRIPDFNDCDYAIAHTYLDFGDRYLRMPYYYWYMKLFEERAEALPDFAKRKFCNFVYTNFAGGAGALLRQEFCKAMMKREHVDCAGAVLKNMENAIEPRGGNWEAGKIDFLQKYKFTISFENVGSCGYTTEKLIHPFMARSVPIYWGNPRAVEEFNPKAFVNCHDYNNDFDAIIERVMQLHNDDEQYMAMLNESPINKDAFKELPSETVGKYLCSIIERGVHKRRESIGIEKWGTTSVSKYLFYGLAMKLAKGKKREYYKRKFYNMRGDIKF